MLMSAHGTRFKIYRVMIISTRKHIALLLAHRCLRYEIHNL